MIYRTTQIRLFLVIAMGALAVVAACNNSEPPLAPANAGPEYVYLFNIGSLDQYWRYSVTDQTIDTFTLAVRPQNVMALSPDGNLLVIPQRNQTSIVACDSLLILEHLPYSSYHGVAISPGSQFVAIHGREVVRLVRVSDWSVVRTDSIVSSRGTFSADGQVYYCTGARTGESRAVHLVPTNPAQATFRQEISGYAPQALMLSPDGTRWYLYEGQSPTSAVVVMYDVATDSVLATFTLPTAKGEMALSPSGERLFVSAPGSYSAYPPVVPSEKVFEFDTQALALARTIDLTGIPVDSGLGPVDIARLSVSDDGTRLLGTSGYSMSYLLDLELSSLSVAQLYDFGTAAVPYYMTD